jgi:hypothetical protein
MILHPDNEYIALMDACVLVPMPVCDTLLRLASDPALYQARWTERILGEVAATLTRRDYREDQVARRLQVMRDHFPEAMVEGYESISPTFSLPDEEDWHVIAAAIVCGANTIVTANLRHFPAEYLTPLGVLVQHPDDFLLQQYHLNPARVRQAVVEQASAIKVTLESLIQTLGEAHPRFTKALSG